MRLHFKVMRGPLYYGLSIQVWRLLWEPSVLAYGWVSTRTEKGDRLHYEARP